MGEAEEEEEEEIIAFATALGIVMASQKAASSNSEHDRIRRKGACTPVIVIGKLLRPSTRTV